MGPFGRAFQSNGVLIDEIDKADIEFNDLLRELDEMAFQFQNWMRR